MALMEKKLYGIYLAYPPTIDLRDQGLGRHLAAFLKGAIESRNVEFIIVCPSWSKEGLHLLMEAEHVPQDSFKIISPPGELISLRVHRMLKNLIDRVRKRDKQEDKSNSLFARLGVVYDNFKTKLLVSTKVWQFLLFSVPLIVIGLILAIKNILGRLSQYFVNTKDHTPKNNPIKKTMRYFYRFVRSVVSSPKENAILFNFYKRIEVRETDLMLTMINKMADVRAWYTPTAFWPSFNKIHAPRLMCVPDVVLTEFPVGFAQIGGDRFLDTFNTVEAAIYGGSHFVTYSEHIKKSILIDRYKKKAEQVTVIPHAANVLNQFLRDDDLSEGEKEQLCCSLLRTALKKSSNPAYTDGFKNTSVKFIFYASQFRPSKNVLILLRAYHYLLRQRFITHKLILTGRPKILAEIDNYIEENSLTKDVLLLSGLTTAELAACYKRADLAVNPSLSEGGCPFTFTEALSVGTPVLMANIPVTTEVLTQAQLQQKMLFDPYDWQDLAKKIEWALNNRTSLLTDQRVIYQALVKRTWQNVVDEYVDALEKITHKKQQSSFGVIPQECPQEGVLS